VPYELDTSPQPPHVMADGISTVLPGVVTPLAWTTGGAAYEYSLRIALCSSLQLLPWPPPDCTWALCALADGRAHLNRDAFVQAADRATDHPRMTVLRAARVRRSTERNGAADSALAGALREGRLRQVATRRSADDLLLSASRLLELLFRCLAHHSAASLAAAVAERRLRDPGSLAAAVSLPRPLPLWGVEADPAADATAGSASQELRPLADAVAVAASELAATIDELAARWAADGLVGSPEEVAFLRYEELPEVDGDRMSRAEFAARTERRRKELTACASLLPA